MKRAAVYLRVSTDEQDSRNQEPQVLEFCKAQKLEVIATFTDVASGYLEAKRPAYKRLLEAAAKKLVDTIVVWKLDRFGRQARRVLQDVLTLEDLGVRVLSATQPILNEGPFRVVVLAFLGELAQLEFGNQGERTRAGIERARKTGTRSGLPIGRPKVNSKELDEALQAVRARGLRVSRAVELYQVNESTLRRALKRVVQKEIKNANRA